MLKDEEKFNGHLITEEGRITEYQLKCVEVGAEPNIFKIKALFPDDRRAIAVQKAIFQGNLSTEVFTQAEVMLFEATAAVMFGVISGPSWFNARKCPLESVLHELHEAIERHSADFQELLKKNKPGP